MALDELDGFGGRQGSDTLVSHTANREKITSIAGDVDIRAQLEAAGVTFDVQPNAVRITFGSNTSNSSITAHRDQLTALLDKTSVTGHNKTITVKGNPDRTMSPIVNEIAATALTLDDEMPASGLGAALKESLGFNQTEGPRPKAAVPSTM